MIDHARIHPCMAQAFPVIQAHAIVCVASGFSPLFAQKFGYVNSAEVIEAHPRVDSANKVLELYKIELSGGYETKVKAFQAKYQFYLEEMQAGKLSKIASDAREAELAKEQQDLQTEEQQLQFALLQKREQLLQPILDEIEAVIRKMGQDGNYTMIFDTSADGGLLFALESDDLTEAVKTLFAAR